MCDKKCGCKFEYGERLEFSDYEDFRTFDTDRFWGYQPLSGLPYCGMQGCKYGYARRPLPEKYRIVKPGHLIAVRGYTGAIFCRKFLGFDKDNNPICLADGSDIQTEWQFGWALIPGYDYSKVHPDPDFS